jgi:hypothetical protein
VLRDRGGKLSRTVELDVVQGIAHPEHSSARQTLFGKRNRLASPTLPLEIG